MDMSDPEIQFDVRGVCNHCTAALERLHRQLLPPVEREQEAEDFRPIEAERQGRGAVLQRVGIKLARCLLKAFIRLNARSR